MNLDDVEEFSKLREDYRFDSSIFISSCYCQSLNMGNEPSRICKRASSLELDSLMSSRDSDSSFFSSGFAGAMRVFSTDGNSARHKGHDFDVPMTCSIQAWQKMCLHMVILAVSLVYGSKHTFNQFQK
jgi:hypothetical protein